ncbi:MAG: DNA/RNA non-specific endonuclease [Fimbriimonadales bacterium]
MTALIRRRRHHSRMRGYPRPGRNGDDRGHLIACAAGGGYDINLVPMDAALNRGWSPEGSRFRALERRAASRPGTLFFIRPVYEDDSDRPRRFEVGVQDGDDLLVDVFTNTIGGASSRPLAVLRQAAAFGIDAGVVAGCLDLAAPGDALFARGCHAGPASLTRVERCAVAGMTGHVAESVAELLLDALDWRVVWHFSGPGRHGVDLVFLAPGDVVVAVEVKGTLVSGRVPRQSRRETAQMSAAWVDKVDNPGMAELGLESTDVYGGTRSRIRTAYRCCDVAVTADRPHRMLICLMSSRLDTSWSVLASHQTAEANRCADIFSRPNGTFGFEEFRRDPEDMGTWTPISYFSGSESRAEVGSPIRVTAARRRSLRPAEAGGSPRRPDPRYP